MSAYLLPATSIDGMREACQKGRKKADMLKVRAVLLLLSVGMLTHPALAQKRMPASEAKDHVGEVARVCGEVVSTHYAASTKGQPTFLNLDKPYPNPVFTVLIWGSNRSKFGTPDSDYRGKHVCATGTITEYRGAPEIVADNPAQIKLDSR
jgi:DNA/RNA endonuclease YhcR with UshA esterase domain